MRETDAATACGSTLSAVDATPSRHSTPGTTQPSESMASAPERETAPFQSSTSACTLTAAPGQMDRAKRSTASSCSSVSTPQSMTCLSARNPDSRRQASKASGSVTSQPPLTVDEAVATFVPSSILTSKLLAPVCSYMRTSSASSTERRLPGVRVLTAPAMAL